MNPVVKDYLFFSHLSAEDFHRSFTEKEGIKPILSLGMRLGEGTGAVLAMQIIAQAMECYNKMATFGSGENREEILAIFKDSRMGTFGVCAIIFDLLFKTFCWNELFKTGEIYVIITSLIFSRCIQSLYLAFLPTAKENSTINPYKKSNILIKFSVLCVFILFVTLSGYFVGLIPSIIYVMSGLFIAILFGAYCMKKINGITGDCVGAVNEISEIAVLIAGILVVNIQCLGV